MAGLFVVAFARTALGSKHVLTFPWEGSVCGSGGNWCPSSLSSSHTSNRAPYTVVVSNTADKPQLVHPSDAIVRVHLAGLCGSDLHPYRGAEEGMDPGTTVGHEFVGAVVAVGDAVDKFKPGDVVVSPFTTCCGECVFCKSDLPCRCTAAQLFGWKQGGMGLDGGQAEYVRVPLANATLCRLPVDVHPEDGLLAGDILSTAWFCATNAGVGEGATAHSTYVVIGLGPVGVLTVLAVITKCRNAGVAVVPPGGQRPAGSPTATVFAVDSVRSRLDAVKELGAVPLPLGPDVASCIASASSTRAGADAVMEAVGAPSALQLAYDCARPGGVLSSVGVHTKPWPFPPAAVYDKNLTIRSGRCPARFIMDGVLEALPTFPVSPRKLVITHRVPLVDAPAAYDMFDKRRDGCIKVVFEVLPTAKL